MQITCLKWGDKYDSSWVNRLYNMVKMNIQVPFTFVCLTEDPTGILPEIEIEPLPLEYNLHTWWWKLTLFEEPKDDINIFLDLDVIIQKDITHWIDFVEKDKLCTIKAYWKEDWINTNNPHNDHDLNSSVMIWKGNLSNIWYDFENHRDEYMTQYRGIDSVLFNHHHNIIKWIPRGEIYSRLYGEDGNNYWNKAGHCGSASKVLNNLFYNESYTMCIFNGYKRIQLNSDRQAMKDPRGARYMDENAFKPFEKFMRVK